MKKVNLLASSVNIMLCGNVNGFLRCTGDVCHDHGYVKCARLEETTVNATVTTYAAADDVEISCPSCQLNGEKLQSAERQIRSLKRQVQW